MKDMNKIYDLVISNQVITTEKLTEYGFSPIDIRKLVVEERLRKNQDGTYEFLDIGRLFSYGKYLARNQEIDKSNTCFLRCLEINPNDSGSAFYMFMTYIRKENYEEAFKYLDILFNCKDSKLINDLNLYLYLMSYIIKLPDKYKAIVDNISYEDVQYDGFSSSNLEINETRNLILKRKFLVALTKIRNYTKLGNSIHASDFLVKKMLIKITDENQLNKNKLKELIKNKDYQSIIDLLRLKPNLPPLEEQIYKLSSIYIEISKTKKIPIKNCEITSDLSVAIERNNFELALELITISNVIIYPILINLIDLINGLLKEQIISFLNNQDLDNAFISIKQYLTNIGSPNFEQLVVNTIKLSLMEDNGFIEVKRILDLLEKTDNIDSSYYVEKYNTALESDRKEQARIYLDIINSLQHGDEAMKWNLDRRLDNELMVETNPTVGIKKYVLM